MNSCRFLGEDINLPHRVEFVSGYLICCICISIVLLHALRSFVLLFVVCRGSASFVVEFAFLLLHPLLPFLCLGGDDDDDDGRDDGLGTRDLGHTARRDATRAMRHTLPLFRFAYRNPTIGRRRGIMERRTYRFRVVWP